jgi:hypothetical protein
MIVQNAYEYFDKQKNKYNLLLKNTTIKIIKSNNDLEYNKFIINDSKGTIKLKGNISTIAIYNNTYNIWQWAWSIPYPNKIENYIARKVINYAFDINTDNDNNLIYNLNLILKAELLNSKLFLAYPDIEKERFIAISLYLTKSDYFYVFDDIDDINNIYNGTTYLLLHDTEIIN